MAASAARPIAAPARQAYRAIPRAARQRPTRPRFDFRGGSQSAARSSASRFARDLMVQEVGHAKLRERDIDLIAADNPASFIDETPTAKLVRQVLGAISEFDKAMTVAKLRGARERK